MILHTSLTRQQVRNALYRAQAAGLVTPDVNFAVFRVRGSRTHARAIEVQLGTPDKWSLPEGTTDQHGKRMRVRRYKNSGTRGAASEQNIGMPLWAATWHEWGWFMAFIFAADPQARFGGLTGWGYRDARDFDYKTGNEFMRVPAEQQDLLRSLQGPGTTVRREDTGEALAQLREQYRPVPASAYENPDYVSPDVQRSAVVEKQLAANEELLDDPVFGPPPAPGTKFGW